LKELTTDELKFTTVLIMTNYNSFDLLIKNLEIIGKTPEGDTIVDLHLISGTIAAKHQKTFSTNDSISFTGDFSSKIFSTVQGTLSVTFAGIYEKTIPFIVNITASFHDLLANISPPTIDIVAEISEITEKGVVFHGTVNIENPNFFEMSLENLTTRFTTENGTLVGQLTPLQGSIKPTDTSHFHVNGTLFLQALNAKIITIYVNGKAGIHLMGINKSITLSTKAQLPIPDIKKLLFQNESLGISITLDVKIRLRGFLTTIGLQLYNPTKIPLQANDMLCSIYGLTGENIKMISQKSMEPCTIESNEKDCVETQVLIPYIKLFTSGTKKILPDWFVIRIQGNFSIAGVYQSIPISIDANINSTLIR
jgi:LEA14-like dessication related protein